PRGRRNHDGGGGHQAKNHRTHHASSFGGLPMRTTPNPAKCFAPAPALPRFLASGTFGGPISCESRPARRTKLAGTRSLQRNDVSALLPVRCVAAGAPDRRSPRGPPLCLTSTRP